MFLLNRAKPKIISEQVFDKSEKHLEERKLILVNNSDLIKLQYTNIFGQKIDTTYKDARKLVEIKICVNKFKDYHKESLIKNAITNNKKWVLSSSWGQVTIEYDKLILKPKDGILKFIYYKKGKKIKQGNIRLTKEIIEKISLFERKLYLMKNASNGCTFKQSYELTNSIEIIELNDNSCSGFSNEELLNCFNII
jgi:hypothetical protein